MPDKGRLASQSVEQLRGFLLLCCTPFLLRNGTVNSCEGSNGSFFILRQLWVAQMFIPDPSGIGKRIDSVTVTRDQIKLNPAASWRVGPVVTLKPQIARGQTEVTVSGGNLVLTQIKTLHFEDILQLRSGTSGIND